MVSGRDDLGRLLQRDARFRETAGGVLGGEQLADTPVRVFSAARTECQP